MDKVPSKLSTPPQLGVNNKTDWVLYLWVSTGQGERKTINSKPTDMGK